MAAQLRYAQEKRAREEQKRKDEAAEKKRQERQEAERIKLREEEERRRQEEEAVQSCLCQLWLFWRGRSFSIHSTYHSSVDKHQVELPNNRKEAYSIF